mgnify:CR=1 FL=1
MGAILVHQYGSQILSCLILLGLFAVCARDDLTVSCVAKRLALCLMKMFMQLLKNDLSLCLKKQFCMSDAGLLQVFRIIRRTIFGPQIAHFVLIKN